MWLLSAQGLCSPNRKSGAQLLLLLRYQQVGSWQQQKTN